MVVVGNEYQVVSIMYQDFNLFIAITNLKVLIIK